jgi:AraC-like DNA-binding protein
MLPRERRLVYATSYGFLAISLTFIVRLLAHDSFPEFDYYQANISKVLFMMLIALPVQYYCSTSINSVDYSVKVYLVTLSILMVANILTQFVSVKTITSHKQIDNIYLLVATSVFIIYSSFLTYKFYRRLCCISDDDNHSLICHKNDIFIFLALTIASILLLLFMYINVRYIYVIELLSLFTIINVFLFFRTTYPFNYPGTTGDNSLNDPGSSILMDRHKINRQISENMKAEELYERLLTYFEKEKPYLRADLKIREVAMYLYSNKTYLSRIINDKHNQNFNQFVNYYRIEETKRLYYSNLKLSIQDLSNMSGFGSMATFSIAFRYYLGYTPADWCKEQKLKLQND